MNKLAPFLLTIALLLLVRIEVVTLSISGLDHENYFNGTLRKLRSARVC